MSSISSDQFDWVVACILSCVLPFDFQDQALSQVSRVLKPGGRFCLLEMDYSKDRSIRKWQDFFARFVEKIYGSRFDRNTLRTREERAVACRDRNALCQAGNPSPHRKQERQVAASRFPVPPDLHQSSSNCPGIS
jgi:SAM-dependent methyltransferase